MLQVESSWNTFLEKECKKKYFKDIQSFLYAEKRSGKTIYPLEENIFRAFELTPVHSLKVVILGQDPYHGANQAHGLSFSVKSGVKLPPSLKNIYKEIENEGLHSPLKSNLASARADPGVGGDISGDLTSWAEQGVLLLNSILTVEAEKPASHRKSGWETFTDAVISEISSSCDGIVFLLWGNFARSKKSLIDSKKHFILESPHPSPLSAYNGFFGNGHFTETNHLLKEQGKDEIQW